MSSTSEPSGERHECPECGDTFDSEMGVKVHYGEMHEGSIAGSEHECDYCGCTFRRLECHVRGEKTFCSNECHGKWKTDNLVGEDHPRYNRVELTCKNCGDTYELTPSRAERSSFCSDPCQWDYWSGFMSGEDNPNSIGGKREVECSWCGENTLKHRYQIEENEHLFCDSECKGRYYSENFVGEDAFAWTGGTVKYYGPNWSEQREKALERDDRVCQSCGKHESDNVRGLSVHHIVPIKNFINDGELDYERANKLDNLISFCDNCHKKWEGMAVMPRVDPDI